MNSKQSKQVGSAVDWVKKLQEPVKVENFSPLAQRFVFSLRLIAVYRKAGKDPFAELSTRLGSMTVAAKALQLVETIANAWPEPVQVRRCCCQIASFDELTLAGALDAVANNQRATFDRDLFDLLPSMERETIWNAASELITAEYA